MVPLLEHGEQYVIESTVVARYIARHVGGPELYPRTPNDLERIEGFLSRWADVETTYYDLLRASSDAQAEERRALFVDRLAAVDELLDRAPFLLGDDFSFAECIAGPWVQRFFVTLSTPRGEPRVDVVYITFHAGHTSAASTSTTSFAPSTPCQAGCARSATERRARSRSAPRARCSTRRSDTTSPT